MDDRLRLLLKEIDPKALGVRIRSARQAAGLTQAEVAAEHVSTPYISRIEAGDRRPEFEVLTALAGRLGVSLEGLLTGVESSKRDEMRLRLDFAELSFVSGDAAEALQQLESLADDLSQNGVDRELADAVSFARAKALEGLGRVDEAVGILEALHREGAPGPRWIEASAVLASCYRNLGQPHRAIAVGEETLGRLSDLGLAGSPEAVGLSLTTATAYHQVGSVDHAVRLCEAAVDDAERAGSDEARARAYWHASVLEYDAGHVDSAIELAGRALVLLQRLEDALREARLRNQLANYLLRLDPPRVDEARRNLRIVASVYEATPARPLERLRNRLAMARADFLDGAYADAEQGAAAVLAETRTDIGPTLAADASTLLGRIAFAQNDLDTARQAFREAILHLARAGADRTIGEAWFELAGYLEQAGDHDGAREAYRTAGISAGLGSHALHSTSRDEEERSTRPPA